MEVVKTVVKHYRIPEHVACLKQVPKKGRPLEKTLLRYKRNGVAGFKPSSRGGRTEVILVLDDGREITGVAECSMSDNFDYKFGKSLAQGRAMLLAFRDVEQERK